MTPLRPVERAAFEWSAVATAAPPSKAMPLEGRLFDSPPMVRGEAISSWLYRVATRHGVSLRRLCADLKLYPPNADVDTYKRQPPSDRLALLTDTETEPIRFAQNIKDTLLVDPEYRCLTSGGGQPIARYCPICLNEDAVPHFRQKWRMAFNVVCQRHPIRLRSNCPHCGIRLDPLRRGAKHPSVLRTCPVVGCHHCHGDLRTQSPSCEFEASAHRWIVGKQEFLWQIIRSGRYQHPRFGTISARCLMQTYLIENRPEADEQRLARNCYAGLNWKALFGPLAGICVRSDDPVQS